MAHIDETGKKWPAHTDYYESVITNLLLAGTDKTTYPQLLVLISQMALCPWCTFTVLSVLHKKDRMQQCDVKVTFAGWARNLFI